MNLTEFLLARIAEDEEAAQQSASVLLIIRTERCAVIGSDEHRTYMHFDRHGPARVLAECDAKRRIVELAAETERSASALDEQGGLDDWAPVTVLRDTLRLLALPYADHPDYDESWRP